MRNDVTMEMLQQLNTDLFKPDDPPNPLTYGSSIKQSQLMKNLLGTASPESPAEVAKLKSALTYLSPDIDRGKGQFYTPSGQPAPDYWLAAVWAMASLDWDEGEDIARSWSQQCPNRYTDEGFDKAWNGFKPDHRNPIGIGSLYKRAMELGWTSTTIINPQHIEHLSRIDRTDAGNVAVLAGITSGNLRYVLEHKTWLVWSGKKWEIDTGARHVHRQALWVAEHYIKQAEAIRDQVKAPTLDDADRKRLTKVAESLDGWAIQCRNKTRLDAMLGLVQRDERFTLKATELNRNPWLLGVANGVVDLKTGVMRPESRDEFVTKRCPVNFHPTAKSPHWERFISEITATPNGVHNGKIKPAIRHHLAAYLQRALGYCLTGDVSEQVMFIAVGSGSNGKNVLLDTFKAISGDYAETIAPEVLMAAKFDNGAEQASPSTRKLAGARVAISSESKDGQKLDLAVVKRHTGGGFITARGLHESPFTFEITHKLVLMTNHKPKLDHMDDAIKGRLHMVPFDMKWNRPGETRPDPRLPSADKCLMQTLKVEYEGILAWFVAGAVAYAKEGLAPPAEVVAFTKDYIESQDLFAQWLHIYESCPAGEGLTAEQLHFSYQRLCVAEGEKPQIESSAAMGRKLKERGFMNKRGRDGSRYGLRERKLVDEVDKDSTPVSNV